MDGNCVRCGQVIPAWLTFTLGPGGRVYCSEYCQRLDEQHASDIPTEAIEAANDNGESRDRHGASGDDGGRRKRLRFLSRSR